MNQETPTKIPDVVFKTIVTMEPKVKPVGFVCPSFTWKDLATSEIFRGKKIVLFALPGAYTPTCSSAHLPGYEAMYDEFKQLGVDEVYCLSVNDAFVMYNWAKDMDIKKVKWIPDGSGLFTEKMGMLVAKDDKGFGKRSWRYSMYAEDGLIKKVFREEGKGDNLTADPFAVSDAKTMLDYLKSLSMV